MVRKRSAVPQKDDEGKVKRSRSHKIQDTPQETEAGCSKGANPHENEDVCKVQNNTKTAKANTKTAKANTKTAKVNTKTAKANTNGDRKSRGGDKHGKQTGTSKMSEKENVKNDALSTSSMKTSRSEMTPQNGMTSQDALSEKDIATSQNMTSQARVFRPLAERSRNILHCLSRTIAGMRCSLKLSQSLSEPVNSLVRHLQLYRTARPFDRRCTALEWHPARPGYLVVASKGGDLILWNTEKMGHEILIEGSGAGGSCQAVRFMPGRDTELLTASIDGTVRVRDLSGKHSRVLLDTQHCETHWYCSADVHPGDGVVATGDNFGRVTLLDGRGNESWTHRLHSKKVTHVEFHPRAPWLLCTASLDKMCKLWDIRMVRDRKSALHVLGHDTALNSAYFNPLDGTQLLITDQKNEIRVYAGPAWHIQTSIPHPHRFFRHLSPIKACWHPLADVIAVGRYPDEKFPGSRADERRTVDVFCAKTGRMVCQLHHPSATGVISLNQFSPQGDALASTMGVNILVWSRKELVAKQQEELMAQYSKDDDNGAPSNDGSGNHGNSRRGAGTRRPTKEKKTKTKTTKTEQKAAKEKLAKLKKS